MQRNKNEKKKEKMIATVGADGREASWASQGLRPNKEAMSGGHSVLPIFIANSHPLFLFPLSIFFLYLKKKKKTP
jgi:hypothetical protein